jgi:ribosome biogenesis GTPase A
MRILEQKKIPYTAHFYEEDGSPGGHVSEYGEHVAEALGQDPAQVPSKPWWPERKLRITYEKRTSRKTAMITICGRPNVGKST